MQWLRAKTLTLALSRQDGRGRQNPLPRRARARVVESSHPSQGLSEEWPENGPPKAQPRRKRSRQNNGSA